MSNKKYTITAALPYANGPLHIGHLAGAYISADIYARYLRLKNETVVFICGSDEHGAAITIKAKKEGVSPQDIVDKYHTLMRDSFKEFGISFDIYHRTSSAIHYETSQNFFRTLNANNAFETIETEQYYDVEAKQFLADRYITGTCPKCSNDKAYGDQCEKCGTSLNPTDLIQPTSTLSGTKPEMRKTKHWFLKLDAQQNEIKNWLDTKENTWKNHVLGQCKSWINDGLKPRAMTRDLDWGIPVPTELEGAEGKVLYVWLDAPIGYISATKQLCKEIDTNTFEFAYPEHFASTIKNLKTDDWKGFWQDENAEIIHFIGKDNIVFHCITFPAILQAHKGFQLPANVPANEFMNLEGDKISTSRNWAVWLHEYLLDFPDKQDELRYVLTANMPENKDSEFTWNDYQTRVNNELVANLGNFVNRVAVLLHKYYDGKIPSASIDEQDEIIFTETQKLFDELDSAIAHFRFKDALNTLMRISSVGNKYLQDNEPWKLIKTDPNRTKNILYVATQICGVIGLGAKSLLPKTAEKMEKMFNTTFVKADTIQTMIPENIQIHSAELLFTKIENDVIDKQIEKLKSSKQNGIETKNDEIKSDIKPEIQYDDFAKMDIRTGIILQAEKVEKADKLLQLLVDIGSEQRTIVSGIAMHYNPSDIIGKKVSVLINLAPRKLRGIESKGMILMAEDSEGKLHFVNAETTNNSGLKVS